MTGLTTASAAADLIGFVAPGLLHGLGNSLFAIQGHAQMLRGTGADVSREKGAILTASEKAKHALDVIRYLLGDAASEQPPHAGILLRRLFDTMRVPMRENGLRVRFVDDEQADPPRVDGVMLCQCVVQVLRTLAPDQPDGLQRTVLIELQRETNAVVVGLRVEPDPACLPFPVDHRLVVECSEPVLALHGARLEADPSGEQLRLWLPATASAASE